MSIGCGCKEVYLHRFPHITYPYSSCICSFLHQHPYFLFIFKNVFHSCSSTFLCNLFNNFLRNINTKGQLRASHGNRLKEVLHIMFYTQRSTHKSTLHILRWTSAV